MIAFVAFSLKRAWQGFWRNALMSLAATATMVLMLVLLAGLIIILTLLNATLHYAEGRVEVIAYLEDSAPMAQVQQVETDLKGMKQVTEVTYVSKGQALADFRARQGEKAALADVLPTNPLPASLQVKLANPSDYAGVVSYLTTQKGVVKDAQNMQSTVNAIINITGTLRSVGVIILAVVGFTVLFIIVNTIRLAVVARAEEIEIMRLVGASDAFIRWPFIFEGAMVGVLGALVTIALLSAAQRPLADMAAGYFNVLPIDTGDALGRNLAAIVMGTGLGIGVLGSWLSVRSYLIR